MIRSGGQTGADQGGLVAGHALGLRTGGWMPLGLFHVYWRGAYYGEGRVPEFREWIATHKIAVLNVAGNRESVNPGIAAAVRNFLILALA